MKRLVREQSAHGIAISDLCQHQEGQQQAKQQRMTDRGNKQNTQKPSPSQTTTTTTRVDSHSQSGIHYGLLFIIVTPSRILHATSKRGWSCLCGSISISIWTQERTAAALLFDSNNTCYYYPYALPMATANGARRID
jgi:hypothetical protein